VSNLREHTQTLREAVWLKALRESALGQILARSPEVGRLLKQEEDLKQHLRIDLAKLRDDILGDLVVLAYRPAPPGQPQAEEGLLLLWARKPELLSQFIDRLNEEQTRKKQLKQLKSISYRGEKYFCRAETDKTHYYFVRGSLLAFSSKEGLIRATIEQQQRKSEPAHPLVKQVLRARAHHALATLWVNPRAFDAELEAKTKQALGQEAQVLQSFFTYWKALDAIVVSADLADALAIRLSLQVRPGDLPKSVRRLFTDSVAPSDLWARFPADSILRIAGRLDAEGLTEAISELTPSSARTTIDQRYLAPLGLDLTKLGPDWGICVAAGSDKSDVPLVLAALAVQPGKMTETLYAGAQGLAAFAVLAYNSSHADAIRLETAVVDKVEVKYLTGDKAFPTGVKPAFALKDGYFLFASSPAAMRSFKKTAALPMPKGENAIAQLSLSQLSKFIKVRRAKVIAGLAEKNQIPNAVAEQLLDGILTVFDLFDHLLLSERRDAGQLTWSLRLAASK